MKIVVALLMLMVLAACAGRQNYPGAVWNNTAAVTPRLSLTQAAEQRAEVRGNNLTARAGHEGADKVDPRP